MNLSQLLASRPALLRQATLANTAYAYALLRGLGHRIEINHLGGLVRLLAVDPTVERYAPQFIALSGSQAILDEHFDEADVVKLADALVFASPTPATDFDFRLEDMFSRYGPALRSALQAAGVELGEELKMPDHRT